MYVFLTDRIIKKAVSEYADRCVTFGERGLVILQRVLEARNQQTDSRKVIVKKRPDERIVIEIVIKLKKSS